MYLSVTCSRLTIFLSAIARSVGKSDSAASSCDVGVAGAVTSAVRVGVGVLVGSDEGGDGDADTTDSGENMYENSGGNRGRWGVTPGGGRGNAESEMAEYGVMGGDGTDVSGDDGHGASSAWQLDGGLDWADGGEELRARREGREGDGRREG